MTNLISPPGGTQDLSGEGNTKRPLSSTFEVYSPMKVTIIKLNLIRDVKGKNNFPLYYKFLHFFTLMGAEGKKEAVLNTQNSFLP